MTYLDLSAHAEEFLAMRRAIFRANPRRGGQDRRRLRYNEKLVRGFITYWQEQGCPWPIPAALVLDWVTRCSSSVDRQAIAAVSASEGCGPAQSRGRCAVCQSIRKASRVHLPVFNTPSLAQTCR